jgi:hypothetical protein
MNMNDTMKAYALAGVGLLALLALLKKKGLLAGVAAGAVGAVADVGAGAAVGLGSLFGLPATDADKCAAARASGSLWDQSLYCTAPEFGSGLWQSATTGAAEVVQKVGEAVGVPRTNESECDRALREGRTWDASFACPAGRFLGSIF